MSFKNNDSPQVQETLLLLAEAYTVNGKTSKALEMYERIIGARKFDGQETAASAEQNKDIYRKMAPLYSKQENYK